MKKFFAGIAGFIVGAMLGYCIILFGWVALTNLFDMSDREGAMTMGVAFTLGPMGAVVFGIVGAFWLARAAGRRAAS